MKLNSLLLAGALALLTVAPAFAGGTDIDTGATSQAGAISGSQSAALNQGVRTNVDNTFNSTTPANTQTKFITTPDVSAPGLTTTLTETCMGSISAGVGVLGIGASGGKTYTDEQCVRRLDARELYAQGWRAEACYVMADDPRVARAFAKTKRNCSRIDDVASAPSVPLREPVEEVPTLPREVLHQDTPVAPAPLPEHGCAAAHAKNPNDPGECG